MMYTDVTADLLLLVRQSPSSCSCYIRQNGVIMFAIRVVIHLLAHVKPIAWNCI